VSTAVRPWLKVLGIAGSLRRGSYNRGLIRAAAELAPDGIEVVPLEMDLIPLYNADLEAQSDPKSVERLSPVRQAPRTSRSRLSAPVRVGVAPPARRPACVRRSRSLEALCCRHPRS